MKMFRRRNHDILRPLGLARRRARPLRRWAVWAAAVVFTPALGMAAYTPSFLQAANNLSDLASASTARTNLGLGTAATSAASAFFSVANNLSEGTAATMRTNLGLGSIATQAASNVAVTGGAIDGATLGATTRAAVKGTTGDFNGILTTGSGVVRGVRVVTGAGAVTMATSDDIVEINKTVGAATAVNFVASPTTGTTQCVKDGKSDAATNNITLTPAAGNIDGAATFVMNQNKELICFFYDGTSWQVM